MQPRKTKKKAPSFNWRAYCLFAGPVLVALLGVVIYMAVAEDEEVRQIRRLIETARQIAMNKDIDAGLALLHESYTDNLGNDYESVYARARREIDEVHEITVKIRRLEIEVNRGVATAKFQVRFTANVDDGLGGTVPIAGIVSQKPAIGPNWEAVTVQFLKTGDGWLVSEAIIQPVGRPFL